MIQPNLERVGELSKITAVFIIWSSDVKRQA